MNATQGIDVLTVLALTPSEVLDVNALKNLHYTKTDAIAKASLKYLVW
jgi:hypothetical protein